MTPPVLALICVFRKRSSVQHTLLPSIAASTDDLGEVTSPQNSLRPSFVPFQRNFLVANGLEVELGNIIVENVDEPRSVK